VGFVLVILTEVLLQTNNIGNTSLTPGRAFIGQVEWKIWRAPRMCSKRHCSYQRHIPHSPELAVYVLISIVPDNENVISLSLTNLKPHSKAWVHVKCNEWRVRSPDCRQLEATMISVMVFCLAVPNPWSSQNLVVWSLLLSNELHPVWMIDIHKNRREVPPEIAMTNIRRSRWHNVVVVPIPPESWQQPQSISVIWSRNWTI
jgi:hypothetical protein